MDPACVNQTPTAIADRKRGACWLKGWPKREKDTRGKVEMGSGKRADKKGQKSFCFSWVLHKGTTVLFVHVL